jgi:Holliday junction resolvase RusA-like endonuclease
MTPFTLVVHGEPAAQGSKRLVRTRAGRTLMLENSAKVKPWRTAVAQAARVANCPLFGGDVAIHAVLLFVRPASHFGKAGQLRASAPERPGYIDVDKGARAILDALAGIAYQNDRQVAVLSIQRMWAEPGMGSGAWIEIAHAPTPEKNLDIGG